MTEIGVRAVRAYLRSRGPAPASLLDRYVSGFCLLMAIVVLGQPLAGVLAGLAEPVDPDRMGAGVALLALALCGFLAGARAAGPVAMSAPDASWLLLSPLSRRYLLARPVRTLGLVVLAAGLLFGVGLAAVLGAPDQLVWRVLAALVLGVAATVGGTALAVLGQADQPERFGQAAVQPGRLGQTARSWRLGQVQAWQLWLTGVMAALLVLAVVAVTGQLRTVLTTVAHAPLAALAAAAAGAVVGAGLLARHAWRSLDRIPARTLLAASTRAGHVANATTSLDLSTLTWIAEDNHWRARKLTSRRWPVLPAPLALAWQDWRRLARRPGRLALIAGTAVPPAILGQAGAPVAVLAIAVLMGGLAVAATATSGARRDADNPALARLIGTPFRATLAARAVLPALLSGVWTALALLLMSLQAASVPAAADAAAVFAGDTAVATGDSTVFAGDTAVFAGDSAVFSGDAAVFAGDAVGVALSGSSGALLGEGVGAAAGQALPVGTAWLFGPLVGPALAAGALRMARREPVDHTMPVIETPGGAIPTGPLKWAATGPDLALAGSLPALVALTSPGVPLATCLAVQAVWGAVVLAAYVRRTRSR
ncbi:DUF6297 family protein [Nonomuraea fastidiosa]|uniref:DUF6297 family protein n=1 Tax=Nonomuraea fastidiosa TaxID=46173 RepID=UPI00366E2149